MHLVLLYTGTIYDHAQLRSIKIICLYKKSITCYMFVKMHFSPSDGGPVNIRYIEFVIAVSAGNLAPSGGRPLAGNVQTVKMNTIS